MPLGAEDNDRRALFVTRLRKILHRRTFLVLAAIVIAILLTVFRTARNGKVELDGRVLHWKLLLYTLLANLTALSLTRDIVNLFVSRLLGNNGMMLVDIGHSMASMLPPPMPRVGKGGAYSFGVMSFCTFIAFGVSVLVALVQKPVSEVHARCSAPDRQVQVNTIGGKVGGTYCFVGMQSLYNASAGGFSAWRDAQTYAFYRNSSSNIRAQWTRETFIPKTPQIGPYATACRDDDGADIFEAEVGKVRGLLYECNPVLREWDIDITDFPDPFNESLSLDLFRVIKDEQRKLDDDTRAFYNVTLAFRQGRNTTVTLAIYCEVLAAEATLNLYMNEAGVMAMSVNDRKGIQRGLALTLPEQVLGLKAHSLLPVVHNAIGSTAENLFKSYATNKLDEWDGIIRAVTMAYAIRSADETTFVDSREKLLAKNVKTACVNASTGIPELRVYVVWIPVALALFFRLWVSFSSIAFTGKLTDVLDWLRNGGYLVEGTTINDTALYKLVEDEPLRLCIQGSEPDEEHLS